MRQEFRQALPRTGGLLRHGNVLAVCLVLVASALVALPAAAAPRFHVLVFSGSGGSTR